jgi:hypothetical protein
MRFIKFTALASISMAFLLAFGALSETFAQGRGGGRPANPGRPADAGRPTNPGRPSDAGRPTNPGVDRGIGTASERSGGRSNRGLETASERSGGRSDAGLQRARMQRENSNRADREINENPGIGRAMGMNASELRNSYQAALADNPSLKFGEFVRAQMIANNLSSTNPGITSDAILSRMATGSSIRESLTNLGLTKAAAKRAEAAAKRAEAAAKRQ